jgi:lipopolysaccharide export system protein LptA
MRAVGVVALAILAATGAHAQGIDFSQGGAVEVTARGGFEWRENEQVVIATGDARAVRGDVTVLADRLIARYR